MRVKASYPWNRSRVWHALNLSFAKGSKILPNIQKDIITQLITK